jgi:hypothetical protein
MSPRGVFWVLYIAAAVFLIGLLSGCANTPQYPETIETRTCIQSGIKYDLARVTPANFANSGGYAYGQIARAFPSLRLVFARNDKFYTEPVEWHECEHLAGRHHDYGTDASGGFREERIPGEVLRIIASYKTQIAPR